MTKDRSAAWFAAIAILAVGATIGGGVAAMRRLSTEDRCTAHGYPMSKVTIGGLGEAYCIRRLEQSDKVVPLDELENR